MAVLKSTRLRLKTSGSVDAVREYLRTTREYYAQAGESANGRPILPDAEWWDTTAADRLGLNDRGRDQDEDFAKLLAGYHPRTGAPLVQNAGEAGRCMGLDLTFSPRKEYSLAFVAATPEQREQMTQAFHLARDKALGLISKGVNTRAGKGGKRHVAIDGLVIRAVDHIDSRSGDPQWHCHAVVANVALDADGEWRSVDFSDLMQQTGSLQEAAQEVFARELAEGFQRLGFGIERTRILDEDERDTGKVANKIAGIEQSTCDAFSSRRAEIKEAIQAAAEKGKTLTGGEAAMKTRAAKHLSASEVLVAARSRLEELAALTPGHFVRAGDLLGRESTELEKQKSARQWFDELHATDSHWNRSALIAKLARELPLGTGLDIPEEADRLLAEWEANGTIIRLKDDPKRKQARWCSRDQWFLEVGVLPAARARVDDPGLRLSRSAARTAITMHEAAMSERFGKEVHLTDEQKASVYHVLCETGGLACIIGQAGTGKSASAGAYIRAFELAGRRVIGTSTSQAATDNLKKEAGIEGYNCAELLHALDSGKLTLGLEDVIVLDEAGMVGAKTFRRIQEHVDKAGGKLVAVGDPKQLEAIEAGGPFAELCEKFGAAEITQIQRQRNPEERALAESFYDDKKTGQDIVDEMLAKGFLRQEKRQVKAMAEAYLADERSVQDKLIVVHTHKDAAAVDHYVRRGLKANGVLHERAVETLTLGSGEYERQLEVCLGERIRFQKNDRKDKDGKRRWNNNDIGTVIGFKRATSKRGLVLKIKMDDDGRVVEVDTAKFQRFGYAYARTAHSAQGLGAESVYWLARGGMIDRNAGLVAMTRTKSNFHAFASPEEVARLAGALDEWGKKETVKELARRKNAPEVAATLQQPLPTALGEKEHPLISGVQQVTAAETIKSLDHAQEVQRAGREFDQAMTIWQERCMEEGAVVLGRLEALKAPDGDIQRYKDMAGGDDPYIEASLKKKFDKAMRELKRLEERKAVLTRASSEHLDKHGQELMAWLDGFYIGGSEAARRDKELRNAPTRLPTLRERAVYRRLAVLERSQISLDDIGTPLEYAHPAPEPAQPEPTTAPVGDAGWKKTQQIMVDQEVFFTRLAERQRRKIERDRQQRAHIEKAGDDLAKQTVVLGAGTTVSLDDIDWETSRFPDRAKPTRVDPRAMRAPTSSGRNPAPAPRKRPGMLPTQPRLPTAPEPPKPPGWDQEIGF